MNGPGPAGRGGTESSDENRHAAVRDFFTEHRQSWLDRYRSDSFDARNYRRRGEVALALLGKIPRGGHRLLDLGCGAGVQAAAAERMGWRVTGTDLTPALLRQASEAFPAPQWVAAAAEALPFPAASFDAVVMLGLIGYVADPAAALRSVRDLLVPGGSLVVSWARSHTLMDTVSRAVSAVPDRLYGAVRGALPRGAAAPAAGPSFYTSYNRFWDRRAFTRLLGDAGFTIRDLRGVNYGQFRFMDHALWPERVDAAFSAGLERTASFPLCGGLGQFTRTHIALVRRGG